MVAEDAYDITAAMDSEVGSKRNTANKEEKRVQAIHDHRKYRNNDKSIADSGRNEVEERQHRYNRHKHNVVDDRWITANGIMDHVSDKSHDKKGPEKLCKLLDVVVRRSKTRSHTWSPRRPRPMILDGIADKALFTFDSKGEIVSCLSCVRR